MMKKRSFLAHAGLSLILLGLCHGERESPADVIKVSTSGHFVDGFGRVRIFRGFNDVGEAKGSGETPGGPQYQPYLFETPEVVEQLEKWGFNAARVPMMWSGLALEEGMYDYAYASTMMGVVADLNAHGMYSLLDMHQDVLSSTLGEYDGAPQWLTNRTERRHAYPWPLEEPLKSWGLGYMAEATGQSFQEIYDNTHGGLDAWGDVWKYAARLFKDVPGILGYELLNEPWAGDVYAQPSLMVPGVAGAQNLQPSYASVAASIREVDDDTIIFYEPVTWGMIFPGDGTLSPNNNSNSSNTSAHPRAGSGFTEVPGGETYRDRSCLSYHYYCWFASGGDEPMPPLTKAVCDRAFGPLVFATVAEDIKQLGGAAMLTEFGAVSSNMF